jgi:large subunit ribosomal protein L25
VAAGGVSPSSCTAWTLAEHGKRPWRASVALDWPTVVAESDRPSLEVETRSEVGSRAVRRLRRAGFVPGVVYGGDDGCVSFKIGARRLRQALQGGSAVLDLRIGGDESRPVIVKEEQRHPVRGDLLHIDLLQVRLDVRIQSSVVVDLEGAEEAPGVKEGGVLEHVTRELAVEALPTDIPERIVVDVSGMEAAATMSLAELSPPRGVEFLDDPEETIIATVTTPTEVEEPEEIEEETELVREEAGAEGATADEAEQQAEAAE